MLPPILDIKKNSKQLKFQTYCSITNDHLKKFHFPQYDLEIIELNSTVACAINYIP